MAKLVSRSSQVQQNIKPSTPVAVKQPEQHRTLQGEKISYPANDLLGFLGHTATQAGTAALGAPANIVQGVSDLGVGAYNLATGENAQAPEVPLTTKKIRKFAEPYISEAGLNPEGYIQETLDATTQSWPLLALGGAPLAHKIGADLASSAGMTVAKKSGLGAGGQLAAGLLGSMGFNKASHLIKKTSDPNKLINMAKTAENEYWKESESLGRGVNHQVPHYEGKLNQIKSKIEGNIDLTADEKLDLLGRIELLKKDVSKGRLNAGKLSDKIVQINNAVRETPYQMKAVRRYLTDIRSDMFDAAEEIGKSNPKWYKKWTEARDISKAVNYQSSLADMFDRYPNLSAVVTHPIVKKILGFATTGGAGLGFGVGPLAAVGAGVGGAAVTSGWKKAEQIWGFVHSPVTRGLLRKAATYTVNDNVKGLTKVYSQLDKEADKYEKKNPELFKPELVSRSSRK